MHVSFLISSLSKYALAISFFSLFRQFYRFHKCKIFQSSFFLFFVFCFFGLAFRYSHHTPKGSCLREESLHCMTGRPLVPRGIRAHAQNNTDTVSSVRSTSACILFQVNETEKGQLTRQKSALFCFVCTPYHAPTWLIPKINWSKGDNTLLKGE